MDKREVLQKYLDTIPIGAAKPGNHNIFIIGFIGIVGSGKSTVAKLISQKLNIFIASNDLIRKFLRTNSLCTADEEQPLVEYISVASTEYLLKHKISHIIDADLIRFYKMAQDNAAASGVKLYILKLNCSEEEILKRINHRTEEVKKDPNYSDSRGTEQDFHDRINFHQTLPADLQISYTIKTDKELDPQVNEFLKLFNLI